MVAAEKLGWVDRRCVDRPVGRDRRRDQTRRMGDSKMTREIADWFHRYRWWPWLVILTLLPGILWPGSYWIDVRTHQIASTVVGESPVMLVDQTISHPFYGAWSATIRQWDGGGWTTWCNANGTSNYRPESRFPKVLTLKWWTDEQCHPLPQGRYKVTTRWTVRTPAPLPDKDVVVDSNIFEVR